MEQATYRSLAVLGQVKDNAMKAPERAIKTQLGLD